MKLSGWGRYPVLEAQVHAPRSLEALSALVRSEPELIARGNGRSYGDSAINHKATIAMGHLNRMLAFDPASGQLVAEAGVLLADIISVFLPRGWFPMVTPGTKFVTLGGAIAADVHGKNHHADGSFRSCVDWVDLLGADGEISRCGPRLDSDIFNLTLGGMGLTGVIVRAAIRLRPVESAWVRQTTLKAPDLRSAIKAFEDGHKATYSVAWIDCMGQGRHLGRSLVMMGEHALRHELPAEKARAPFRTSARPQMSVPFDLPGNLLNGLTVRAFNAFYYAAGAGGRAQQLVDWDRYFYPLDAITGWNRIYGSGGFAQFQCVLPLERSEAGLRALLAQTARAGSGSFLAVLKRMGPQESAFSFPMEGYTLALDFPMNRKTLALLERLDQITIEHGGRFYLAKDSRMTAATLEASDNRVADFRNQRHSRGLASRFSSAQAKRLAL